MLAPNASLRKEIVPSAPLAADVPPEVPADVSQGSLFGQVGESNDKQACSRKPWAWLLRHVFAIDIPVCPKCSGAMRWLAIATTPEPIANGLARAGLGPPNKRAPFGQLRLGFSS